MKQTLLKGMVVLTFLTVLLLFPQKAHATTKTKEEALQWVRSQVGKSIDADGYAGAQCVDLILAYYDFLGVPRASGNGTDYTHNALPAGWNRIQGAQPQPGDILVYTSGYGHVAIYESDRVHYHQNFANNPKVERITYMYNGLTNPYWGVIRPNFASASATPPVISDIQIIEQDSQGYVVQCKASAAAGISRVQFPTWTTANGQDDIIKDWGTSAAAAGYKYGDYYRYRVNISDHNNEHGVYATHIYAYDKNGNYISKGTPGAVISAGASPQEIVKYDNTLLSVFNENLSWSSMNNFATKAGSRLVSIPNEQKQTVVYNLIKDRFRAFYSVGGFTASKGAPWQWLSGEPFTYSNFASNQPDCSGNTEFYLSLYSDNGKWNDLAADYGNTGFVLETPLDLKPNVTITSGNTSYLFYNVEMPYAIAKRFCEENGGMLACVTSKEENDLLAAVAKEQNFNYFLGATDEAVEGTFAWCSGEAFSYTNWAENEPNNDMNSHGGEDYVQITTNGTWNDHVAQVTYSGFVCEIVNEPQPTEPMNTPVPSTPEPTPTPTPPSEPVKTPEPTPTLTPENTSAPGETPGPNDPSKPNETPGSNDTPKPDETVPPDDEPGPDDTPEPSDFIYGDLDGNGSVDASDALYVLKIAAKLEPSTGDLVRIGDVDGNGSLDASDALLILQKAAKLIDEFPIERAGNYEAI